MSRLSYKTLFIIILFLLIPIVFLLRINKPTKTLAAWWNESWMYRQSINISSHTTSESNVYLTTTVNIGATNKAQADNGDFRFTDQNGQLLDYYLVSGAGTTAPVFHIQLTSFPSGAQTLFAYYGNPSAVDGFSSSDFSTAASNYTIGSLGAEETGGAPIAWWKFDEGVGTTLYDSSGYNNTAILAPGSSAPTWATNDQCVSGKCLNFDGIRTYDKSINTIDLSNTNKITLSFWLNWNTFANDNDIALELSNNFNSNIGTFIVLPNDSSGKFTFGNRGNTGYNTSSFTRPTSNTWHHYSVIIDFSSSANNEIIPFVDGQPISYTKVNSADNNGYFSNKQLFFMSRGGTSLFGNGYLDDVKIYSYARTIAQIKQDYATGGANTSFGSPSSISSSDGPIGYWKFEEGYGSIANNSGTGGNSLNGILGSGTSSPSWTTPGKVGKALSFDGNNDIIDTGTAPALNINNAITISAWIKQNAWNNYPAIVAKGYSTTGGYSLHIRNDNTLWFELDETNGTRHYYNPTNITLINDNWTHVAATYDGFTQRIYINGIQVGTGLNGSFTIGTITNSLQLGKLPGYGTFNGFIDEIKIYDYALSADEIKTDYNQSSSVVFGVTNLTVGNTSYSATYCVPGSTDPCSPPIAEWKFEEGVGTTVYDTSGNNNNGIFGTGSSAPTWTTGKIGKGLSFNGVSNYIDAGDPASGIFDFGTDYFTIETWFKYSGSGTVDIVGKGSSTNYLLSVLSGNLLFWLNDNNCYRYSATTVNNGRWHHVAAVFNGTGNVYIDGKLSNGSSSTSNCSNSRSNSSPLTIGKKIYSSSGYFLGQIDNVKIYNYARTPSQIAWDYNLGGPIGWWKFDECQGSIVHDSSGIGNTGTLSIGTSGTQNTLGTCTVGTSAAWTAGATGKFNSSLNFDGADDWISLGGNSSLNTPSDYSIAMWVYNKDGGKNYPTFLNRSGQSGTNGFFWIYTTGTNDRDLNFQYANGNTYAYEAFSNAIPLNNWVHVLFTLNNTTKELQLFINGNKFSNSRTLTNSLPVISGNLYIGTYQGSSASYPFYGQIDDVRIYNYALTPDQIKQIYNGGAINFN